MNKLKEFVKENFLGYTKEDIKAAFGDILKKIKPPSKTPNDSPEEKNSEKLKKVKRFVRLCVLNILVLLMLTIFARPLSLDIAEWQNISPITEYDDFDDIFMEGKVEDDEDEELNLPFLLVKPPQEPNRRLTRAEMRWIFFHETRLLAMRRIIHDENEKAHHAYSAMVADFNARGANYEYEFYERKRAETDIEPYKEQIAENAKEDALNWGWGKSNVK